MKKNKIKIVALLLFVLFMTSNPYVGFASTTISTLDEQIKDADKFGKIHGEQDGKKDAEIDFFKGLSSDYKRNLLHDSDINVRFKLDVDQTHYRNYFQNSYKKYYAIAYETRYRELQEQAISATIKKANEDGKLSGQQKGMEFALYDFLEGNQNNWEAAYSRLNTAGTIESRYFLSRDTKDYREIFKAAFIAAFKLTYAETYRNNNTQAEFINTNVYLFDMYKKEFPFEDIRTTFISGVKKEEKYKPVTLSVEDATLYKQTPIALSKLQDSFNMSNYSKLEPASNVFHVSVRNPSGMARFLKPVKLTFEYMGSEYAGIYQFIKGQWVYMPSTLTDGKISTLIPEGNYENGLYAIFIDPNAKGIHVKRSHWAKDEMYTLARRGVDLGASASNPSKIMTRVEYAKLLYKVIQRPQFVENLEEVSINFATTYGYLTKDSKNQFSKYEALTYGAFEKSMSIYLNRTFKWAEIEEKMLRENFVKSKFGGKLSNPMPSDEVYYAIMVLIK